MYIIVLFKIYKWQSVNLTSKFSGKYFCLQYIQTKVRWRFCKQFWPSQNIWTLLISYIFTSANKGMRKNLGDVHGCEVESPCTLFTYLENKKYFNFQRTRAWKNASLWIALFVAISIAKGNARPGKKLTEFSIPNDPLKYFRNPGCFHCLQFIFANLL